MIIASNEQEKVAVFTNKLNDTPMQIECIKCYRIIYYPVTKRNSV